MHFWQEYPRTDVVSLSVYHHTEGHVIVTCLIIGDLLLTAAGTALALNACLVATGCGACHFPLLWEKENLVVASMAISRFCQGHTSFLT